jgi:hypothetical protein
MMGKPERPSGTAHAMIAAAEARVAAGAISTILVAVAGAITLVAIAYAIFAALRDPLTPAGASAATALVFALVTAGLAVIGPKVIKARASSAEAHTAASRPTMDPHTLRTRLEIGFAVLSAIAEAAWQRRRKR